MNVPELVEQLILKDDKEQSRSFFLTYKTHASALEVLKYVQGSYFHLKNPNTNPNGSLLSGPNSIHHRTLHFLREWMINQPGDWKDTMMIDKLLNMVTGLEKSEESIIMALNQVKLQLLRAKRSVRSSSVPEIDLQRRSKLNILEISPQGLSQYLTMRDWAYFSNIQSAEFLGNAWQKKDKETNAPNICALIDFFNKVSSLVATTILKATAVQKQAEIIDYFINVMLKLYKLNNLNSLSSVLAGLNIHAVQRLKTAWKNTTKKDAYKMLDSLMSPINNYSKYREVIRNLKALATKAKTPVLPYLPITLRDITCTSETTSAEYLDLDKMKILSTRMIEIRTFQENPFNFPLDKNIDIFIRQQFTQLLPEEEMYKMSLIYEPMKGINALPPDDFEMFKVPLSPITNRNLSDQMESPAASLADDEESSSFSDDKGSSSNMLSSPSSMRCLSSGSGMSLPLEEKETSPRHQPSPTELPETIADWSKQQVMHWFRRINMMSLVPACDENNVTGIALLNNDPKLFASLQEADRQKIIAELNRWKETHESTVYAIPASIASVSQSPSKHLRNKKKKKHKRSNSKVSLSTPPKELEDAEIIAKYKGDVAFICLVSELTSLSKFHRRLRIQWPHLGLEQRLRVTFSSPNGDVIVLCSDSHILATKVLIYHYKMFQVLFEIEEVPFNSSPFVSSASFEKELTWINGLPTPSTNSPDTTNSTCSSTSSSCNSSSSSGGGSHILFHSPQKSPRRLLSEPRFASAKMKIRDSVNSGDDSLLNSSDKILLSSSS